jgi:hypothetical protein
MGEEDEPIPDLSDDSEESDFEDAGRAVSGRRACAKNTETWQRLDERYAKGVVEARPAQKFENATGKTSKHDKDRFWKNQKAMAGR